MLILGLQVLCLLLTLGGGWLLFQSYALNRGVEQPLLPATDWVSWRQTPQGLVCERLMPPLLGGSAHTPAGISPGDTLLAVDYKPVFQLEHLNELRRNPLPGALLLYKLATPGVEEEHLQFVEIAYSPPWLLANESLGWQLLAALLLVAFLVTAVVFVASLPLRSTNAALALEIGFRLSLALLLFALPLLRHWLAHAPLAVPLWELDAPLLLAQALLLSAYGLAYWPGKFNLQLVPALLAAAVGPVFLGLGIWREEILRELAPQLQVYQHLFALLLISGSYFATQDRSVAVAANPGLSRTLSLLLRVFLVVVLAALLWNGAMSVYAPEQMLATPYLLAVVALLLPVGRNALYVIRYGNLGWVVIRLIIVMGVVGVLTGIYSSVKWLLQPVISDDLVRQGLALAAVLAGAGVMRLIYVRIRGQWSLWVQTPAQRRLRQLQAFMDKLPHYGRPQELAEDLEQALGQYTLASWQRVRLPEEQGEDDPLWREAADQLALGDQVWGRRKELLPLSLTPLAEQTFQEAGVELALGFRPTGSSPGLILLGKKNKGVYTLDEVNQLRRVGQQLRLTLDLLNLVDREKSLARQAAEANLTALRSQINPHFLFNTLNTISSLIHDAPDQAEEAIILLGDIFRYTLRHSGMEYVTFAQEMSLVRNYLSIEQIRFGEQLVIETDLDPEAADQLLPAFVIQTLVENAIKHGVGRVTHQGWTAVNVGLTDGFVVATVEDNGPGVDLQRIRQGTGLNNVIERLSTIYGRTDLIEFVNNKPGTTVTLRIPPGPPPTPNYDG